MKLELYESVNLLMRSMIARIVKYFSPRYPQVQISAYLDNVFDVAALMEDSETKTAALEKVAELEDELGHVSSRT